MLPSTPHVREVYLTAETGIIAGLGELEEAEVSQSLFIDSTTLDQKAAVEVAEQIQGLGALMVDAPVSGGVSGAKAATLSVRLPDLCLRRVSLTSLGISSWSERRTKASKERSLS